MIWHGKYCIIQLHKFLSPKDIYQKQENAEKNICLPFPHNLFLKANTYHLYYVAIKYKTSALNNVLNSI